METLGKAQSAYFALRVASAMCFIGHGCFGIIGKPIWCNYFAVIGVGHELAYKLMPVVGTIDILLGVLIALYPVRIALIWLVCWGIITAALRPLSGEPFAEFIERAGNFGAPLSLLLLYPGNGPTRNWLKKLDVPALVMSPQLVNVTLCLRIVAALLLTGHGLLNLTGKQGLLAQYARLGFSDPHQVAVMAGALELLMAVSVLIKPLRSLLLITLIWKIASELFYPHYEIFEWVERGGSYGVLLALWFTINSSKLNIKNQPRMKQLTCLAVGVMLVLPGFINHNFKSNEKDNFYFNHYITYCHKNIFTGVCSYSQHRRCMYNGRTPRQFNKGRRMVV